MRVIKIAVLSTSLAYAAAASAQPSANTEACVPPSLGLPGSDPALGAFYGPPQWAPSWTGAVSTRAFDSRPDDPRWVNAGGASISDAFTTGSTLAPVELRLLGSDVEGGNYVYLSWRLNVGDTAGPRTLRIALKPSGQMGKVLRVRLPPTPGGTITAVTECASDDDAVCAAAATGGHYKVFTEQPTGPYIYCNDSSIVDVNDPCHPGNVVTPWLDQSLRAWKLASGVWTVQVRIPVVAGATRFAQGLAPGTAMAFDATIDTAGTFGIFHWPRAFAFTSSPNDASQVDAPAATTWGSFRTRGGGMFDAPATGACTAIRVETNVGLGIIHNPTGATNYVLDAMTTQVRGAPSGTPVVNELVVRVENNSDKNIAVNDLIARFRIAKWGAQIGDISGDLASAWLDVRGGSAVTNSSVINAGTTGAIHFPWTLNSAERCAFGVPTAADLATVGCVTLHGRHQCLSVDLTGSSSLDVDFETRGTWNNFDFSELSITEDIAAIDLRGLGLPPGRPVDVYLIGMARNMPEDIEGEVTGADLVTSGAGEAIGYEGMIFGGEYYGSGQVRFNPQELQLVAREPALRDPKLWSDLPRVELPPILRYLPEPVYRRYRALATLARLKSESNPSNATHAVVSELGAAAAATVVPTLDVYALYQDPATGRLLPLTSFSYFLSHQGALSGMHWVIDGATRVSDNVYKIAVANGVRDINVRSQAQTSGETQIVPNPDWKNPSGGGSVPPCQGCCCGGRGGQASPQTALGTGLPIVVVAVAFFAVPRRRKKRTPPPA